MITIMKAMEHKLAITFKCNQIEYRLLPINKSSFAGKQIGMILSWKSIRLSNLSNARSFSYVKKLYFGWTIFLVIFLSMFWRGSLVEEKSHSPIRTRIFATNKLFQKYDKEY